MGKWRRDEVLQLNQVITITSTIPTLRKINNNRNHNKTIHLLVKMNNHVIQGLIDIEASMLIIVISVVRELGLTHLVASLKSYKIAFRVVT